MNVELDPVQELLHRWEALRSKRISPAADRLEDWGGPNIAYQTFGLEWWCVKILDKVVLDYQKQGFLGDDVATTEDKVTRNCSLVAMESTYLCFKKLLSI